MVWALRPRASEFHRIDRAARWPPIFLSPMARIALLTSSKYPRLTDDDRLLLAPLAERGIVTEPVVWDDPSVVWSSFDAIVIRSCWDYHLKIERFLSWTREIEAAGVPVFNPAAMVRWNTDKGYLRDLEAKGIPIVPTVWGEGQLSLKEKLRELGWNKAVVKPRVSATAYRTHVVTQDDADSAQALFEDLRRGPGVMVQKFMDKVPSEGEWSLIFFGGKFSHAVIKQPTPGDFRVQSDFGGTSQLAEPPLHVLASAAESLRAVEPTLYARVDGVVDEGEFRLMELELIEPALFLSSQPEAPRRFADAIVQMVSTVSKVDDGLSRASNHA